MSTSPVSQNVVAHDLLSGEQLWETEGACYPDSVADGSVAVLDASGSGSSWVLADVATGEVLQALDLFEANDAVVQIPSPSETLLFGVGGEGYAGLPLSGEAWRVETDGWSTPLGDGRVGIRYSDGTSEWISVLDESTGEVVVPKTDLVDEELFTWATDGYILVADGETPEYAFYDLEGNQTHTLSGERLTPFNLGWWEWVLYSLDDHQNGQRVRATDASGAPSVLTDERLTSFTRAGEATSDEFNFYYLDGLSVDGELAMFIGDGVVTITDLQGEIVQEFPAATSRASISDGFIVIEHRDETEILIPTG